MNSRMWLRQVLPVSYFLTALFIYVALVISSLTIQYFQWLPVSFPLNDQIGAPFLTLCAFAYGVFRVGYAHPLFRKEYRDWLHRTPWSFGQPLPLGPVQIVLQDLFHISILTGLSLLHEDTTPFWVPMAFLSGYLCSLTLALGLTAQHFHLYLLLFGFGGLLYLGDHQFAMTALLTSLYVIGWLGLQKSLMEFHFWDLEALDDQVISVLNSIESPQDIRRRKLHGWPFDRMAPRKFEYTPSWSFALATAALVAWWDGGMMSRVHNNNYIQFLMGLMSLAFIGGGIRTGLFIWGYAPPLNLWGRITKGRLIIPGYDKIFIAPILVFSIPITLVYFVRDESPAWLLWAIPCCAALQLLIIFKFPPSLDAWRLTGNHRIVPATSFSAQELQQTQ